MASVPFFWLSSTSARRRREDRSSISSHPLADLGGQSGYVSVAPSCADRSSRLGGRLNNLSRREATAMGENAPCDACQLVGKRDRQHVAVQPPLGRLDPGFEPVALPVLRPDQDDPGGLNEEGAQVAIAALRYLAKDCAVSRRELFGDKTQPGGEVAALGGRIPGPDRRHHRARDNRPDPRHAHQPLATDILARNCIDLARQAFDPLIQPTPVASQILDEVDQAHRQPALWIYNLQLTCVDASDINGNVEGLRQGATRWPRNSRLRFVRRSR